LAEALLRPALPAKAFQTLQDLSVTLLVGQQNSPEWVHHHAYLAALYPKGDPALRYETPESVANVTLQDVRVYHAAVFRPDLTTIVITGNIDPIQARIVVERYFATWRGEGPKPETDFLPVPDNKTLSILVPDASRQQADVILAQTLSLNRSHPDYYPFQTGMSVLSGSTASRLYQSLRETRGLVYAVDAEFTNANTRSLFTVTYGTDPKQVDKVRTLIERNLDNLRLKPVSPAELNQAKKTLIRQLALTGTSTDSTATLLLDLALDDLPLDLPAVAARQIQQVTPRQVQAAFKKWLRPGAFVQVTSGPVLETAEKRGAGQ
jgi:zinc protease